MSKSKDKSNSVTYETATGEIEFTLRSDMMFHYVMQNSKTALTGLVCALKGLSPDDVQDIIVENPIDLNSAGKETIMDIKLTLNSSEILNIELQVYPDKYWISRSILYLCRAYDNIGSGDNYSLIKPTTLFCITDLGLIPKAPKEFYAKYRLTNLKNHHLYTDKFGINVLQLNHTDLATEEDISNNLVYWANLFKATTWEEFKKLAKNHPDIEEVGNMIFELNYDNQAKEILEGQRRYREQMNSQYTAGYTDAEEKYETVIAEKDNMLSEKDATIAQKDDMLSEKDATIAEKDGLLSKKDATIAEKDGLLSEKDATIANKDSEITKLRAELEKYKNMNM
ncbi:Rpn family recombination-promoting nuclease/putative transposase [Butyrivibrio sp. LB2008]|uniref:Rpn family recombination-promoting nuclease/putative transposase n=1 Tax=Butyrivibrio sp. LB2008 TaxID=1408305 RepID=UPI000478AD15|nr:Rpn family recombination-promoting nuclease/putative transposase [Butyrivibrio sp. LB2008]